MSQPPPKQTGKCVVCLKDTKSKCSSCAANGIDWFFFCSQEHQKLIWPLHKRVCGPRGRPWCWPALSKKEIREMIELYEKPRKDHVTGAVTSWRDQQVADMKIAAPVLVQAVDLTKFGIETFKELLANLLESSDGLPLAPSQHLRLVCNRSQAWVSKRGSTYFDKEETMIEFLKLIALNPFNFLAHFEKVSTAKLVLNDYKKPWWSDLQHRITNLLAFTVRAIQLPIFGPGYRENEVYRRNAYDEAMRYRKEVIEPDDEEAAEEITLKVIKVLYFEHTQVALYTRGDSHNGTSFQTMLCDYTKQWNERR